MRGQRTHARAIVLAVLATITGVVLALDVTGVVPGPVNGALTQEVVAEAPTAPQPWVAARPVPVVAPLASVSAPIPSASGTTSALRPLLAQPALGDSLGVSVLDVDSGAVLVNKGASGSATPASTTKLLTAATALTVLGPQTRFSTRVAQVPGASAIFLVGGGDPSLARATSAGLKGPTMTQLATQTAAALKKQGRSSVRVVFDDSLFVGPRTAPQWPEAYVATGVVSPVSALSVDAGRVSADSEVRSLEPAQTAADVFASSLRRQGVTVSQNVRRGKATTEAVTLTQVESPTVSALVAQMLTTSDNDIAEALGHLAGGQGAGQASFAGGARATVATMGDLGVATQGVRLFDASGLARENLIPPKTLTGLLAASASPNRPELRGVLTGMPVAGLSGTLDERFVGPLTGSAAGEVRAKTGSLSGVSSLAGVVVDRDGRQLAFAVMADEVPIGGSGAAEAAIDRVVARLTACGCA